MIVNAGPDFSYSYSSYVDLVLLASMDPKVDVNAARTGATGGALGASGSGAMMRNAEAGGDTVQGKCGAVIDSIAAISGLLTL